LVACKPSDIAASDATGEHERDAECGEREHQQQCRIVDRYRDGLRLAGNAAADHQDNTEFAERMGEREHETCDDTGPRERQLDPQEHLRGDLRIQLGRRE